MAVLGLWVIRVLGGELVLCFFLGFGFFRICEMGFFFFFFLGFTKLGFLKQLLGLVC